MAAAVIPFFHVPSHFPLPQSIIVSLEDIPLFRKLLRHSFFCVSIRNNGILYGVANEERLKRELKAERGRAMEISLESFT